MMLETSSGPIRLAAGMGLAWRNDSVSMDVRGMDVGLLG